MGEKFVYALNVWTGENSFWGTLGVYESYSDAHSDGELVVNNIDKFTFYKIETVQLVNADNPDAVKMESHNLNKRV